MKQVYALTLDMVKSLELAMTLSTVTILPRAPDVKELLIHGFEARTSDRRSLPGTLQWLEYLLK